MAKLLILLERSNLVAEYIGKDMLESAPARAKGSLTAADIFVESPNGLTTIESGTFGLCRNLMEIIIPDTLTTIGDLAFEDCNALKNIYFTGNEISDSLQVLINKHEALLNATIYVYKETEPELNDTGAEYKGNYWHYVNGEPTIWTYYEEE